MRCICPAAIAPAAKRTLCKGRAQKAKFDAGFIASVRWRVFQMNGALNEKTPITAQVRNSKLSITTKRFIQLKIAGEMTVETNERRAQVSFY
jgi:hypothetical protein